MKTWKIVLSMIAFIFASLLSMREGRNLVYEALYGFDDQRSYRGEIAECRFWLYWNPQDSATHFRLGELLASHINDGTDRPTRLKEAVGEFLWASSLNNQMDSAYYELGNLAMNEFRNYRLANTLYKKCADLNPSSFSYQYALAESYEALGDEPNAEMHTGIGRSIFDMLNK